MRPSPAGRREPPVVAGAGSRAGLGPRSSSTRARMPRGATSAVPGLLAAVLALALGAGPLGGQESVFGQLGFGLPEDGLSVRSRGMGGTAAALPRIHFTFRNAASLAVFDRTGMSIGGLFQSRSARDPAAESTLTSSELPFFQLVFPLGGATVLGGGYYRYLDFDGFVDTGTRFRGDSLPVRLTTDGGLSVLSPQLATQLTRYARVGGGVDFYTGSRERLREIEFPAGGVSTRDSVRHAFRGVGFSVGAHLLPLERLVLGAAYRSGATLEGELQAGAGAGDPDEPGGEDGNGGEAAQLEVELPATFYAAASYRLGRRLTLAAEFDLGRWSEFEVDGRRDPAYRDARGLAAGVEYAFPGAVLFLPEGTVLRAGGRTRTLPRRFGGEEVRERALTLGLGQVVGIGASILDLSLEAGRRGSLDDNGLREDFLRLGVSLSAFEEWPQRGAEPGAE